MSGGTDSGRAARVDELLCDVLRALASVLEESKEAGYGSQFIRLIGGSISALEFVRSELSE